MGCMEKVRAGNSAVNGEVVEAMPGDPDGHPGNLDGLLNEGPAPTAPDAGTEAGAVNRRARAVFAAFVIVFLVVPAVAMFLILSSGSDLGKLAGSFFDGFSKELSSVSNRL
jgi:hypothetical protein